MSVSDVVRRVVGVRVQRNSRGDAIAVSRRSTSVSLGGCVLPVYVDGVRSFDADLDRFPPEWIEAMEVYHGIGTPFEYGLNSCGAILIWTR